MLRHLCVCLVVSGVCASHGTAQCSSVPAVFNATCTELQSYLDTLGTTIASQWNGAKSPVAFGGELTTADSNRGLQTLLASTTLAGVASQLNGLANAGVESVTIGVSFPILYLPFYQYNNDPQDYATVLSFYQSVMAAARSRGMKVVIETSVMFPDYATDLPLTAYYATLSAAQVTVGRAQVAQIIAQQLQPDWLNLGSEPDTQSALLGLSTEYTPQQWSTEISTIVSQLRTAGVSGQPLIGAGIGAWQTNGTSYIQALTATGLDYIDLHIYSINLGFLSALAPYIDMAHAAGKGGAISEAWMRKLTDKQLQGKTDFGIIGLLSSSATTSLDNFSFWSPLDSMFLGEMIDLAFWKNLYYISPFPTQFFFAYLDYDQTSNLTPDQLNAAETTAATAALRRGNLSATGQAYASAIMQPSAATHFAVSAPASTLAGAAFNFSVTAEDSNNTTVTGYQGTVHFSSTDPAAVLPANATLTNGEGTFSAALDTSGPQSITAADTVTGSITGTSNTIVVSSTAATVPMGVSPAFGSGSSSTFVFTFSDPRGWQDLDVVNVLVNSVLDGRQACYLAYSRTDGVLYLVNDAGSGLSQGLVLGGPGSVANSQCTVAGPASSTSGSGDTLTLTLSLSFSPSFAGNLVDYLAARDLEGGNSGWQALATWTVPGAVTTGPAVSGMSPARSIGLRQTYNFTFTDTNGWQDISVANVLINAAMDGIRACYVALVPSGPGSGSLFLVDDAGDAGGPYKGMVLPGAGTVSNSQCTIAGTGSGFTAVGNTLTLTLAIAFSPSFAGNQVVYAAARSNSQDSGWQAVGTVTVRDTSAPAIAALDPSSAPAGSSSLTLTVTGGPFSVAAPCAFICGFACPSTSVVTFDNSEIPTQYVNATQLRGVVPASLLSTPRTVYVTVNNPVLIECQGTENHISPPAPFTIAVTAAHARSQFTSKPKNSLALP
ncbi:MAG TPA: hypothetical protein VE959_09685 [Bryobacteraceae bacterium]|nr:hypothetical protein [Bryobacteraceae bacterium]